MPGTLYVVATPIGNLEDVTLRALRVLREVDLIAAEDTRRTARLLQHYSISTRTTSFHQHNERQRQAPLLARLGTGEDVALVSDSGTPTISDPGARLVSAAIDQGLRVEVIPGASAVLAALAGSGLSTGSFTFVGFPPSRSHRRKQWFLELAEQPRPVVFFEAPHRIRASLSDALEVLGDRDIAVGRELTKKHEEFVKSPISAVLTKLTAPRGEITVILGPKHDASSKSILPGGKDLWNEFCHLTNNRDCSRRDAVSTLAKRYGLSARSVYSAIEKAKMSGM